MTEKTKCSDCQHLCVKNGMWYCELYDVVPPLDGKCYNW